MDATFLPKVLILIATLLLASSFGSVRAGTQEHWSFVSNDQASYRVTTSVEAQHGTQLMMIDGTELEHPIEYQKQPHWQNSWKSSWQRLFMPSGHIYQTVKARPYTGKHLHISGFVRGIKPNFAKMEKKFSDYYEGAEKVSLDQFLNADKTLDDEQANIEYQEKRREFRDFIQRSYDNSRYGISVLLDMGPIQASSTRFRWHFPTSFGGPRLNELWNRFNVEVSVPEACESISIVLWQYGVAITEFDHLVVSEQGDAVGGGGYNFNLGAEKLIKQLLETDIEATSFSNLSFE